MSREKFQIVADFKGYVSKYDITNLKPGYLIRGSQNMVHNDAFRIQSRKGYRMDGSKSTTVAPNLASFDFKTKQGYTRNIRCNNLVTGTDGKVQYRYDDGTTVTWRDLLSSLTSVLFRFTTFWNETEQVRETLFVNGTSNVYAWNGALATVASNTATTLTKSGTTTWAQEGFYTSTGSRAVTVNGVSYTYTGGENTTTLTGLVGLPAFTVGDVVHQTPITTAVSSITSMPSTFTPNLISSVLNQVYYGYTASPNFYVSKYGNYKDVSFTGAGRLPTEGATARLDAPLIGFSPQEDSMYIYAGNSLAYRTQFVLSADQSKERFEVVPLQNTENIAPQSQEFITKIPNDVAIITNEPTLSTLGRQQNILGFPQEGNLSDPIKLDFDEYDFTDGSVYYYKRYIYVAVPKEGVIRVYNIEARFWESPLTIPVSRFYEVDGELYGHSYDTSESYKLFEGYADRATNDSDGNTIESIAVFNYMNNGSRTDKKTATEFYVEGYVQGNTELEDSLTFDIDGCATNKSFTLDGSSSYVCLISNDNSLGKSSLGKQPLGSIVSSQLFDLPPKFRIIHTFTPTDYFEYSPRFRTVGVNQRFELLAFGLNAVISEDKNNEIKD